MIKVKYRTNYFINLYYRMELSKLIEHVYYNSKLTAEEYGEVAKPIYNNIRVLLEHYCNKIEYSSNIKLHGSYALNTIMNSPSGDIDLDIGLTFDKLSNVSPMTIKENLYNYLINELPHLEHDIDIGKCAITISLQDIHIDIVIYKKVFGNQYVAWKDDWKQDEKDKQYEKLKDTISGNHKVKQLICFIKFIYKNAKFQKNCILPSIAITELVVQDYCVKFKEFKKSNPRYKRPETIHKKFIEKEYSNIEEKLLSLLTDTCINLNNKFEIVNSGCKENLIHNKKRQLHKKNTIDTIKQIRDELLNYSTNLLFCYSSTALRNVFFSENKWLLLPKEVYDEMSEYDKSELNNYFNTQVVIYKPHLQFV